MSYKSIDDLKRAILSKAKEGVKEKLHPIIQKEIQDSIRKEVYEVYTPLEYKRRGYSGGGLGDVNTMKGYVVNSKNNGFEYLVQSEAKSKNGSGLLAPLIIRGASWAILNDYILKYDYFPSYEKMYSNHIGGRFVPFYEPRDFISSAKESISKINLTNSLKGYMER